MSLLLVLAVGLIGAIGINAAASGGKISNEQPDDRLRINAAVYQAIVKRLGLPWRDGGIDDRGYDCSGLIWRVFTEAGVDLKRASTRQLWEELPEASIEERGEFGTLVFFSDLTHVGVVRDQWSFYHSSSTLGVTRSFYSEYWGERVVGYRVIPTGTARSRQK